MRNGSGGKRTATARAVPRRMAACALAIFLALMVVGVVSTSVLRHLVQTLPLWIVIWLGLRDSPWTRWAAFPVFGFWMVLMGVVWSFLLGWTRLISGTFSSTEVVMTGVVGVAAVVGLVAAVRDRRATGVGGASALAAAILPRQLGVFVVSFRPGLAHDPGKWLGSRVHRPRSPSGCPSPSAELGARAPAPHTADFRSPDRSPSTRWGADAWSGGVCTCRPARTPLAPSVGGSHSVSG